MADTRFQQENCAVSHSETCNTCVCCGAIIPEGRHICLLCEGENEVQTFRPQIDSARILRLCNEIEDLACDIAKHNMNDIIAADSRMIFDMAKEIGEEITA